MKEKTIKNRNDVCKIIFGMPPRTPDHILSRMVYKTTECGGWMQTKWNGIKIGTIVEGSDATFEDLLKYPFTQREWDETWKNIELNAREAWEEQYD